MLVEGVREVAGGERLLLLPGPAVAGAAGAGVEERVQEAEPVEQLLPSPGQAAAEAVGVGAAGVARRPWPQVPPLLLPSAAPVHLQPAHALAPPQLTHPPHPAPLAPSPWRRRWASPHPGAEAAGGA